MARRKSALDKVLTLIEQDPASSWRHWEQALVQAKARAANEYSTPTDAKQVRIAELKLRAIAEGRSVSPVFTNDTGFQLDEA